MKIVRSTARTVSLIFAVGICSLTFITFRQMKQGSADELNLRRRKAWKGAWNESEIQLRILVLTYNRPKSLLKLLTSLDQLELDGDRALLEIWIDRGRRARSPGGKNRRRSSSGRIYPVDEETVEVAEQFVWSRGPVRVNVQPKHVGIYGQWIDTWHPATGTGTDADAPNKVELALILEDDLLVSPYAYRWLRAVHDVYGHRPDFAGATLQSDGVESLSPRPKGRIVGPAGHTAFMYKGVGSWGYSPHPLRWTQFQKWFHQHKPSVKPRFKPYVRGTTATVWYKSFERTGRADTMWTMWYTYYRHVNKQFSVYNNLAKYNRDRKSCLTINRREVGLHFIAKGRENFCQLLTSWSQDFVEFPTNIVKLDWDGTRIVDNRPTVIDSS